MQPGFNFSLKDSRAIQLLPHTGLWGFDVSPIDATLQVEIIEYIKTTYFDNGAPIGNIPKVINMFIETFRDKLAMTPLQVRQAIDTTVSKARIWGQIEGHRIAGVKTFEIMGPKDNITCSICQHMIGKIFQTAPEVFKLTGLSSAYGVSHSLMDLYSESELIKETANPTTGNIQNAGFALPPYHPSCRCCTAAESFYEDESEIPFSTSME